MIYPDIPVLTDKLIQELNAHLSANLSWLANQFGKVQPITKYIDGRPVTVPATHSGYNEYTEVYPSDVLACFNWYVINPYENTGRLVKAKYKTTGSINFFIDLNKIYPDVTASRDLENVKLDIITALSKASLLSGAVRFTRVYENYSDVYSGYTLPQLQDKYFMQPYAGLRFDLDIWVKNSVCPGTKADILADNNVITADSIEVSADGQHI